MNEELIEQLKEVVAAATAVLAAIEPVPADDVEDDVAEVPVEVDEDVLVEETNEVCPTCGHEMAGDKPYDEEAGDTVELRWFTSPSPVSEKRTLATTAMPLEVRELPDGQVGLAGYAAVFNSPSLDMGFIERIAPGAFKRSLAMDGDVRLLVEHDGVAIGRTKSGTLSVFEDERGLRIDARVDPANPKVAEVVSAIRRGDLDGMSFGFRTIKDSWNETRTERVLEELQLFEVSLVSFPAYPQTAVAARSEQAAEQEADVSARRRMARARVALLDL